VVRAAKDLHFNKNMEALKKMQAGADKLATVVGVTLGPKVRISHISMQPPPPPPAQQQLQLVAQKALTAFMSRKHRQWLVRVMRVVGGTPATDICSSCMHITACTYYEDDTHAVHTVAAPHLSNMDVLTAS
jgi:hypothetical protein